jgi:branched-chain amino acid transport system ATP-binding protein
VFRLDHVTAGYGGTTVLRDVSLTVPPGSVVALLGPNGAGKTTTLRVAGGLIPPRSGAIRWQGSDVSGASPDRLLDAGICHVPEGRGIFPSLTVRENLMLFAPARHQRAAEEQALSAFPRLGSRLDQIAGSMSGGEQQMLALARAYVRPASLVLLDEVSMGLAPKIVDEIFEFLERLAADGKSLLIVEQFVVKALAIADYVYLLNRGRIVFAGEPAELADADVFAQYVGAGSDR